MSSPTRSRSPTGRSRHAHTGRKMCSRFSLSTGGARAEQEDPKLVGTLTGSRVISSKFRFPNSIPPSVTRLAATTALFSISGFPSSSPNSRPPAVTAAMPASCAVSPASSSSSSTIGASNRSTPAPVVTSTRSSRNAMGVARPSSPVRSRSTSGTPSLARLQRRPASPTCSPASVIIRRGALPNSCPGTGNRSKPPAPPPKPARSPSAYGAGGSGR